MRNQTVAHAQKGDKCPLMLCKIKLNILQKVCQLFVFLNICFYQTTNYLKMKILCSFGQVTSLKRPCEVSVRYQMACYWHSYFDFDC